MHSLVNSFVHTKHNLADSGVAALDVPPVAGGDGGTSSQLSTTCAVDGANRALHPTARRCGIDYAGIVPGIKHGACSGILGT